MTHFWREVTTHGVVICFRQVDDISAGTFWMCWTSAGIWLSSIRHATTWLFLFKQKREDGRQQQGINFFMKLINAPIDKIAVENPIGIMSSIYRKPSQILQPWQYGHKETKATCLWLKNLPKLKPTNIVGPPPKSMTHEEKRQWNRIHYMPPSQDRGLQRSIFYTGFAEAMAEQWG